MESQRIEAFLKVAIAHPNGIEARALLTEPGIEMTGATRHRNIVELDRGKHGNGPRLVSVADHPTDGRKDVVKLTKKGERLAETLTAILERDLDSLH